LGLTAAAAPLVQSLVQEALVQALVPALVLMPKRVLIWALMLTETL